MSSIDPQSVDHVSIAVADLDGALNFFQSVLGLQVRHSEENAREGVRECMLSGDDGREQIQLFSWLPTQAGSPDKASAIRRFLAEKPGAIHHLALRVPNVSDAMEAAKDAGIRVLNETPQTGTNGSRIAFLHPQDCYGVLIELVQVND